MAADNSAEGGVAPTPKTDDVYDRQIRLWGAEAQGKINKAKILYLNITGVSSEILKNMVLAGVRAVVCDPRPFPDAVEDTPTSFFPVQELKTSMDEPETKKQRVEKTVAEAIQPRVEELNPLLGTCQVETKSVEELEDDYFSKYDIVIASRLGIRQACRIASATTKAGGKFYLVDCFGWWGVAVVDIGDQHSFREELGKDKLSDVTKLSKYVPLKALFDTPLSEATDRFNKTPPAIWMRYRSVLEYHLAKNSWPNDKVAEDFATFTNKCLSTGQDLSKLEGMNSDDLKKLASIATAQVSPVCAVLGGVMGNEVIKVISGKGEPANNTLFFDGTTGKCQTFFVGKTGA